MQEEEVWGRHWGRSQNPETGTWRGPQTAGRQTLKHNRIPSDLLLALLLWKTIFLSVLVCSSLVQRPALKLPCLMFQPPGDRRFHFLSKALGEDLDLGHCIRVSTPEPFTGAWAVGILHTHSSACVPGSMRWEVQKKS